MKELVQMGVDLYKGHTTEFSQKEVNDKFREKLLEVAGTEKIDYKTFRRIKPEVFQILEETLQLLVVEGLEDQFDGFAEFRNIPWGDSQVFHIEDDGLFKVARISDGNGNIRRQRIDRGQVTVEAETWGVKVYEELYRFLAGRIDWNDMVNRVARSMTNAIRTAIYDAVYDSYDALTSTYAFTGSFDADELTQMAAHVEAATGANVEIMGTAAALAKVEPEYISEWAKDDRNATGFFGTFNGYTLRKIDQAHKPGTDDFAIDDNFLMIVPMLEDRMVKVVNEGEALITETTDTRTDKQVEYEYIMKMGLAVIPSAKYGIYRLT